VPSSTKLVHIHSHSSAKVYPSGSTTKTRPQSIKIYQRPALDKNDFHVERSEAESKHRLSLDRRAQMLAYLLGTIHSMTPPPEDLAGQYAQMSETELMELARSYDGLLEIAQRALRAEFGRRGLEPPILEEPPDWELRRLKTVRRYRDLAEAYAGRSLLESAGISAWIADEHLVRLDWFYSNLVGGLRRQVDEADEATAREILELSVPPNIQYDAEEVFVQPTCPKCGWLRWATGQKAECHSRLYMFSPFRCLREMPPGIATHVVQNGLTMEQKGRSRLTSPDELLTSHPTATPQTNPSPALVRHSPH
jgi:hypothetical protein